MSKERARALRQNQTDAERKLWFELRRNTLGPSFRRQHPIGNYIVDFVCLNLNLKLIIEADGGQHDEEQAAYDAARTAWLEARGYSVLRFWNNDILSNMEGVLEVVRMRIEELS